MSRTWNRKIFWMPLIHQQLTHIMRIARGSCPVGMKYDNQNFRKKKKSKFHLGTWHVNDPVRQWASWGYMSWCILDQCRDLDPCILNLSIFEDGRETTVYLLTDVLPTTLNLSSEICTTNSKHPFQIDDFKWILTKLKNEKLLCICCNLGTEANIVPCNSHVFGMEVIPHVSTVQDTNRDGSRFFSFKREREKEMITELTLTRSSL